MKAVGLQSLADISFFATFQCRLSKSLIDMLREHTAVAEYEDGWNEFVERACRRSLLEGWDSRHKDASHERAKKMRPGNVK